MTDLGTLGGDYSQGFGINNSGQVTGFSFIAGSATRHAFLYTSSTLYDLNDLVSSGLRPGAYLEQGADINDSGWIVATSNDGMAYLLQPTTAVPEPGSLALCGVGAGVLVLLRRQARNASR